MIRPGVVLLMAGLCVAVAAAHAKEPPKSRTIGDLTAQSVDLPPDVPLDDAPAQARDNYQKYAEMPGADPARAAQALRRIGDMELEAGESGALANGTDRLPASMYAPAIARYRELLKRYPGDPHNDAVLYQLARAQDSGGDPLGALASLDLLIARYPKTPQLDEVQFRRGEILFAEARFAEAEHAYAVVLAQEFRSTYREQARYKTGWAQFRQDRYDQAVSTFFELLDARFAGQTAATIDPTLAAMPLATRELVDDTLRATALCFSSQQGLASLQQTLKRRGEPAYGHLAYLSLAAQYQEQKRWTDGAEVLTGYADAHPLDARDPDLWRQAIAQLDAGKLTLQALAARDAYMRRFGPDRPFWKAQQRPPDAVTTTFLRDSVWMVAQQHHAQAQSKAAAPADRQRELGLAADGYRLYGTYFPKDGRTPEAQFLLGEVLFDGGDFAHAVDAYESAAYASAPHAHSAESGYAALLAYQKREEQLSGDAAQAWRRRRLEAGLRFAAKYPGAKEAPAARLASAEGYLAGGASDDALKAAAAITTAANADDQQRRAAWMVMGHASVDAKDYARAEAAYRSAQRYGSDPELDENLAAAIYRQGEQARDAGHAAEAAADFLRVGQTVPKSSIGATADFDAAQAFLAAGRRADAIAVLERFPRDHADSPLAGQASAKLALAYLDGQDPAGAARTFESIAASPRSTKAERQEALLQAAKLYASRHDDAGETRVLGAAIMNFPDDLAATMEARQRLIELADAHGDLLQVKTLSERQIASDAGAGSQRGDRSRFLAAHAALRLAEPTRDAFLADRLTAPLAASLRRKKAHMETALAAFGRAADYGVADVLTESTYRIGELYQGLAKALNESPRPGKLDAQALEQYDLLLQEQAFPFEEKAIALFEANAARAAQGFYDPWVRSSYAALATLVPARYARPPLGAAPGQTREVLEAAVARDPKSAPAQHQLGQVLAAAGEFGKADEAFARAMGADQGFARAYYDRAVLNELYLRRPDEAVRDYEAFQKLQSQPDPRVAGWIEALHRRSAQAATGGRGS